MQIEILRKKIDLIDDEIIHLFTERMHLAKEIAAYKQENNLPVSVPEREEEIIRKITAKSNADVEEYIRSLYAKIFELSKAYQLDLCRMHKD